MQKTVKSAHHARCSSGMISHESRRGATESGGLWLVTMPPNIGSSTVFLLINSLMSDGGDDSDGPDFQEKGKYVIFQSFSLLFQLLFQKKKITT